MPKLKALTWILISFIIALYSCKKEPVASFDFDQNNVRAPATISFTNTSINATEYLWNFGDGTTTTEENPVYEYIEGGDYDVTLKAYGEDGTNSITKTVSILPSMTGFWNVNFTLFGSLMTGRLKLIENENHSLVGEFAFVDDPEYIPIDGTSKIDGYDVLIVISLGGYLNLSFEGTVNSTYDQMSGEFKLNSNPGGTWNATKN